MSETTVNTGTLESKIEAGIGVAGAVLGAAATEAGPIIAETETVLNPASSIPARIGAAEGLLQEIVDFFHFLFPGQSSGRTPPGKPSGS